MKSDRKLFIFEIIVSILLALIILLSLILQFSGIISSDMYKDVAGIFFQVDATIMTLSISLVAIMSSVLSDSYMGISYSSYFLNIRPKIYKQNRIIFISLLFLLFSAVSFWLGWCYVVFGLLLCEILLIAISSAAIYGVFRGKESINREIARYSFDAQMGIR